MQNLGISEVIIEIDRVSGNFIVYKTFFEKKNTKHFCMHTF